MAEQKLCHAPAQVSCSEPIHTFHNTHMNLPLFAWREQAPASAIAAWKLLDDPEGRRQMMPLGTRQFYVAWFPFTSVHVTLSPVTHCALLLHFWKKQPKGHISALHQGMACTQSENKVSTPLCLGNRVTRTRNRCTDYTACKWQLWVSIFFILSSVFIWQSFSGSFMPISHNAYRCTIAERTIQRHSEASKEWKQMASW